MTTANESPRGRTVDMKLEAVIIPVSDVDRSKSFYSSLGWRHPPMRRVSRSVGVA